MIWVILALLGIPLWLIAAGLTFTVWHHRDVTKRPGIFACKARASAGEVSALGEKFPRFSSHALWVHRVLIIYSGPSRSRSDPHGVERVKEPLTAADPDAVKRLGDEPQLLTLRLDDGAVIEVAAAQGDSELLLGPFGEAPPAIARRDAAPRHPERRRNNNRRTNSRRTKRHRCLRFHS